MKSTVFIFLLLAGAISLTTSCKKDKKPAGGTPPPANKFQARVDGESYASDSTLVVGEYFGNTPSQVVSTGVSSEKVKFTLQMNTNEISGTTYTTTAAISQIQINYYNEQNQLYALENATINIVEHDTLANYVKVLFSGEFVQIWSSDTKPVTDGLIQLHY